MIKKMQQKFVAVVMLAYFILLAIVVGGINIFAIMQMNQKYDKMLEILTSNNGEFPEPEEYEVHSFTNFGNDFNVTVETPYENRYFMVYLDGEGNYQESDITHVAAISEDDAQKYAKRVYKSCNHADVKSGRYGVYRYRLVSSDDGYEIAFVDISQQMMNLKNIKEISLFIGGGLMLLLLIIVKKLSKRAIHPLVENMEKQKQFITDAGHELKTPLAIISANADVLELIGGQNEWIDSIRNQTKEMNILVKRLLFLSKMEEGQQMVMSEFNLSQTVTEKINQIKAIAVSNGKIFETNIEENISYKGDMDAIEHLISVLTENAVKYCSENGTVRVCLFKNGKNICFQVRNTGNPIDEKEMSRLFERFYRPDSSRNKKTGGHGIGLSIAKAVVDSHHGKIYVKNEPGQIAFCVELPASFK